MCYTDLKNKIFLNCFNFKERYFYIKKINKYIFKLKNIFNQKQKNKVSLLLSNNKQSVKKGSQVTYVINLTFSTSNTFLHITDVSGNLKFHYSAGLLKFKGKQKKTRIIVLTSFFDILTQLNISFLKNKPVALHLNNVGFYKYFIIKKLKKYFFIRIIKNYDIYSYNGCQLKKGVRKRQKIRKR